MNITLNLQLMMLFDRINIQNSTHKDDELFLQEAKEKGEMPPGIMYKSPPLPPRAPPEKVPAAAQQEAKKPAGPIAGFLCTDPGSAAPISVTKRDLR